MPSKRQDGNSPITPKQKWETIPQQFRDKLIRNVWCGHCRDVVEMLNYRVYSAGADIVLRGRCAVCSSNVARVVEQEYAHLD